MDERIADRKLAKEPLYTFRDITIIRHGATAYNQESGGVDRIRGWKNVPLSDVGREQVKELAKKLKGSGINYIVSSDLERAKETAERVAEATGADLILCKEFRPWDVGEYTGQESMAVHPIMADYAYRKPYRAIPGGESFDFFKARVFRGLREYVGQYSAKKLAIVTHHRVERLIHAWIAKGSPANEELDLNVMFKRGERTAHAEPVRIDMNTLFGLVESK
jgi:glucosyl-3-phosphoglycerate phosphatase